MSLFLATAKRRIGYQTFQRWQSIVITANSLKARRPFTTTPAAMSKTSETFMRTSGERDPVWIHEDNYTSRPRFEPLKEDTETDVCIVGAGISGISVAYELVVRGKDVVLLDARDVLAGESGRTTGHLSVSPSEVMYKSARLTSS